jgi:sugar-phosphatase
VEVVLGAIALGDGFSAVVCGDDVPESKPHPAIFLEAARRLGVAASACAVIEDSPAGMRAGRRAGMTVVGLRSRYTLGLSLPADLLVDSLAELMGSPGDAPRDGVSGA